MKKKGALFKAWNNVFLLKFFLFHRNPNPLLSINMFHRPQAPLLPTTLPIMTISYLHVYNIRTCTEYVSYILYMYMYILHMYVSTESIPYIHIHTYYACMYGVCTYVCKVVTFRFV